MKTLAAVPFIALCVIGCGQEKGTEPVATQTPKDAKPASDSKGASRVDIKHGLDPDASQIDLTPKPIAISELVSMKMPDEVKGNLETLPTTRVGPFEKSTYEVDAEIKSIKHMKDGDFYLVVKDKDGKQVVVEVPDPDLCKGSPLQPKIAETRKALEDRYHPTDTVKEINEPAKIDGVGFFGFKGRPGSGAKSATPRLMPGTGIVFSNPVKH